MVKEKKVKEKDKKGKPVKKVEKKTKKVEKKTKNEKARQLTTFKSELKKIKWPSKKDMIKYSIATVIFVIFFALFFFAIQALMSFLKSII